MQTQPRSDERRRRIERARQALKIAEDAFKGGAETPRRSLGLKRPWLAGTSRLWRDEREPNGE